MTAASSRSRATLSGAPPERRFDLHDVAELLLSHHDQRRRSPRRGTLARVAWIGMESESYYTTDGNIAYIRVRSPQGPVRSEEQEWGLRDYDEQTGDLVGLEVWSASKGLPQELVDALPRLEARGTGIEHQPV